ncbi:hypothetical protein GCM10023172_29190 [Hymenobacter ginsengisoli]|uniref:HTH luxR-type domain-containing protein n=1 Tax=Hymenobacter ginsengisoli TaxID=1051626 RepID=A0ABP8QLP0_9BACT|nr:MULTISPECIES: LuxR C-terminal-related transcriptional regulator [unclassified Hymenobacter]MBO2029826.1 hypothetical protein [Hymenobacter sp. BT559]
MSESTPPTDVLVLSLPQASALPTRALQQQLAAILLTSQFAYVYDLPSQSLVFVSAGVEVLLGERPAPDELTLDWFAARLHPDDAAAVAQAQALVHQYLHERTHASLPNFLFSLDYRLRHADGHYRRVLHECLLLERAPGPGLIQRTLALFTDLSPHKLTQEVRYHVNQPDFAAFAARQQPAAPLLTTREKQILALVLQGLTSRQIAHRLKLSEATVKAHRRNLLRKAGTHNLHGLFLRLTPADTSI